MSLRRYYLNAEWCALALGEEAVASVLKGQRLAVPGTPLPSDFPARARLEAAGYLAIEDFGLGSTSPVEFEELVDQGIAVAEARAVLKALES